MRLCLAEISVVYNRGTPAEIVALANCHLDLVPGDPVVIWGPNGSGKTTLFNVLSGALESVTGRIQLEDSNGITRLDRDWLRSHTEQVQQQPVAGLFSDLTLSENLALKIRKDRKTWADPYWSGQRFKAAERGFEALFPLYSDYKHRRLSSLSGGEQQLFAISLAEYSERSILLFDEPTAALDEKTLARVCRRLKSYVNNPNMMIAVVTHDRYFAKSLGFRELSMNEIDRRNPPPTANRPASASSSQSDIH